MKNSPPKTSTPSIRPLSAQDLDKIEPWLNASSTFREYGITLETLRPAILAAMIDPANELLAADTETAFDEKFFSGFAWCVKKGGFGRSAYLRLIVVAPGAYSSGVGSALMAELERRHCLSDRLKGPGLFLLCTHTNTGAQNFYAKLGYARVGEIPSYLRPALNEVIYWKP